MMHVSPDNFPPRAGQAGSPSDQVGVEAGIVGRVDHLLDLKGGAEPVSLLHDGGQAFGLAEAHLLAFKCHLQKAGMLKFAEHNVDLLAARFKQVSHGNLKISMRQKYGGRCYA